MEDETYDYAEIVAWLKEHGYDRGQVGKILDRLKVYDQQTGFLSEMDSIDGDEFGLAGIIAEALAEQEEPE